MFLNMNLFNNVTVLFILTLKNKSFHTFTRLQKNKCYYKHTPTKYYFAHLNEKIFSGNRLSEFEKI